MGNLLFSPSGRIGPNAYMKGIIIIAIINAVLGVLPLLSPALTALGIAGLVTFYIFIALGIKRSHDAGKSGWMVIFQLLLWIGVGTVIVIIVGKITGVSIGNIFSTALSGDIEATEAATAAVEAPGYVIPSVIGGFVGQLVTGYLINMFNKQDAGDNQFGPVPAA
jgi:uncharacterized membrane protein YhaH (DUF805 family)